MPVLKGKAYHWELLNSEGVKGVGVGGGKREGCVVRLGLLVDFLWFHQKKDGWGDSPRQQPAGVCRRALQPKISEKRKWKNHAVPLQFILCIRVTPKQSFSSPAVRQLCVITWCSKNDIFIFFLNAVVVLYIYMAILCLKAALTYSVKQHKQLWQWYAD